jgi:hypothetical protein
MITRISVMPCVSATRYVCAHEMIDILARGFHREVK